MIVSSNTEPHRKEFDALLNSTLIELNTQARSSAKKISALAGNKLEPFVKDIISERAVGTSFEGSIELISGQRFPDIIANKFYGIEVKTTTQNHWKTTGNSVLESTRVEGIERIYMLFGKLANPIEFRCRPYEDCLSEVVVTHSPRYLIDMNLGAGNTIFDKIKIPYDTLRNKENPIRPIVDYYKSKLKEGEDIWWIDQGYSKSNNFVIKIWNNLSFEERQVLISKGMTLFAELFGNRSDKFNRFAIWLIKNEGIVCPNVRDLFTSGGKGELKIGRKTYKEIPKVFCNLFDHVEPISKIILETPSMDLTYYWGYKTNEKRKLSDWIDLVSTESKKISDAKHLNIKQILVDILARS